MDVVWLHANFDSILTENHIKESIHHRPCTRNPFHFMCLWSDYFNNRRYSNVSNEYPIRSQLCTRHDDEKLIFDNDKYRIDDEYKDRLPRYGIPMLKIRRYRDRLILNMGIPFLVRRHLYIVTTTLIALLQSVIVYPQYQLQYLTIWAQPHCNYVREMLHELWSTVTNDIYMNAILLQVNAIQVSEAFITNWRIVVEMRVMAT